ncbi:MAG TPA: polymer-forming cytoskeletal protein [Methylomirabilota bacterium]
MGALRRTLRYLGLSGGADSDSLAADLAAHRDARDAPAAVGAHIAFRGEVSGEGDFHIAGRFEGDINVTGRVLVGEGADVDANINARAIVVGGTVRGNLSASTRVEILPTGVLTGTLRTGSFSAADGAAVKGEIWIERAGDGQPERRA